jgi:phage FluMu protein Com
MRCTICDKLLDDNTDTCYDDLCPECDAAVVTYADEGIEKRVSARKTKRATATDIEVVLS